MESSSGALSLLIHVVLFPGSQAAAVWMAKPQWHFPHRSHDTAFSIDSMCTGAINWSSRTSFSEWSSTLKSVVFFFFFLFHLTTGSSPLASDSVLKKLLTTPVQQPGILFFSLPVLAIGSQKVKGNLDGTQVVVFFLNHYTVNIHILGCLRDI